MTADELGALLGRLRSIVDDRRDLLKRAARELADGDEEGARLDMAEAIRDQILRVERYDTTSRLVSQTQELRHVRTKLMKGTTSQAGKKSFGRLLDVYRTTSVERDSTVARVAELCARPVAWIAAVFLQTDPVAVDEFVKNTQLVARLYTPVKVMGRLTRDRKFIRHTKSMARGVYLSGRDVAVSVWKKTKTVCREMASATASAAKSGYAIAKRASTSFAASVKSAARTAASATASAVKGAARATAGFFSRLFA